MNLDKLFREIDELVVEEDPNELDDNPSPEHAEAVKGFLREIQEAVSITPDPRYAVSWCGEVHLEWSKPGYRINLNLRPEGGGPSYLYYDEKEDYGIYRRPTPSFVAGWINAWFHPLRADL
jgi:hypothetical protein